MSSRQLGGQGGSGGAATGTPVRPRSGRDADGRPLALALPTHLRGRDGDSGHDGDSGTESPGGFSDTFSPHALLGVAHKPHSSSGHHSRLSVTDASNVEFPFTATTAVGARAGLLLRSQLGDP
jgi:hypothetical protein